MKTWEKPDIKVFNVKMNENIATSAGKYEKKLVNFIPEGDILVYVNGHIIVNTSHGWYMDGTTARASYAYEEGTGSTGVWVIRDNDPSCLV